MRFRASLLLLLLAAAVIGPVPARSATVKLLYLDDIAANSAVIVHGRILAASSQWDAGHTTIYTSYTVQSYRYVKGFLGETFEFQEPGGEVGNVGMVASGTPRFQPGEEVVLMLWANQAAGTYQCLGLFQGVFRVSDQNGVKVVDHSIPIRPGTVSLASLAGGAFSTATSRQLDVALSQLGLAAAQVEVMKQQKEEQQ
jgi:hypothetical protein